MKKDKEELVPRAVKVPKSVDTAVEKHVEVVFAGNRSRAYSTLLARSLGIPDPNQGVLDELENRVVYLEEMLKRVKQAFERANIEL